MITRNECVEVPADALRQISHDVRTPLTTIRGFAELLLDDETISEEQVEYLTIIRDESKRLAAMLEDFLATVSSDEME